MNLNIRKTVQAVILNEKNQPLMVSRKDDHSDMGLPGGKVDPEDDSLEQAISREVFEETGLAIDTDSMILIFAIHKGGFLGYTYLITNWSGEIDFDEPHVVEWGDFDTLIAGSFGRYNRMVVESLDDLEIPYVKDKLEIN